VAAKSDRLPVVRLLLEAGARVNVLDVDGYTPLHEARSVEVARMLLDAGADVKLKGSRLGESALEHHKKRKQLFALLRDADKRRYT
jgi:ankyrin repeat protein